jgi:mono/diheme cytochrome c family protein
MMDRSNWHTQLGIPRSGRAWLVILVMLVAMGGTLAVLWIRNDAPTPAVQAQSGAAPASEGSSAEAPTTPLGKAPQTKTAPGPMVKDWPQPAFVLAITGQQHGYIEPCGCSPKQSGGLARRADLLRQLREDKKWPVLALETGGTLDDSRVTRRQSLLKFNMILDSLNGMGYRALGLGTEELKLGVDRLFVISQERNVQEGFDLPFLAANVVLYGDSTLGTPVAFRVLEIGGQKVAVTSVFGNEFKKEFAQISKDELEITDPVAALTLVLAQMKAKKPDVLVVLSYDSVEASRELVTQFPDLDVVVSADGADDPGNDYETIGKTLFFVSGMKGKHVNLIGFYPGEKVAVRFERVELDQDRFNRSPPMRTLMAKYQELLQEEWLDPNSETRQRSFPHSSGLQFMGAKSCAGCHASAYEVWEGSNHANATASLRDGRPEEKGEWIDRTYDPECLYCHATGWDEKDVSPYTDGFIDAATTPHLLGNQCENCHGPGSEHVKLETDWKKAGGAISEALTASRIAVRITKAQAEKKICLTCHDFDNSPKFDFKEYWPQIEHPTPAAEKQTK